jgi:two-component sensor histidine kinase
VHELVYQSSNFAEISTDKLVRRISDYIKSIYHLDQLRVDVQIRSDDIMLDMNQSVPFSLFLNEALTNIWKHAFVGRDSGIILLEINRVEGGFCLMIRDDGVGVEDLTKLENPVSFGCTIIHGLVGQLQGVLSFSHAPGGGLMMKADFPT